MTHETSNNHLWLYQYLEPVHSSKHLKVYATEGGENHPHVIDKNKFTKHQMADLCRIVILRTLVKQQPTGVISLNFGVSILAKPIL